MSTQRTAVADRTVDDGIPALRVTGLDVRIRTAVGSMPVVTGAGFSVAAGTTMALLGESGCGKSMTAKAIVGLLDPGAHVSAGSIEVGGTDLVRVTAAERRRLAGPELAIVFQDALTALNPVHSVGRQLAEPFRIHEQMSRRNAKRKAIELMTRVGIPDARRRAEDYPHQFSGGLRQRLMIAAAVALRPRVLIADEPTTALDVTVQAQIMKLLRELQADFGIAMVLITHDLAVVAGHADTVAVMYAGTIVEEGSVHQVLRRTAHPYTRALLDSMPEAAERGSHLQTIAGRPPELGGIPDGCVFQHRCPMAQQICRDQRPALTVLGDGHASACHFWERVA